MSGATTVHLVWAIGALVLVTSALLARRRVTGGHRMLRWAALWLALFVVTAVIAAHFT